MSETKQEIGRGETKAAVWVAKYFGIFFLFFEFTQLSGNFISSAVLRGLFGLELLENHTFFDSQSRPGPVFLKLENPGAGKPQITPKLPQITSKLPQNYPQGLVKPKSQGQAGAGRAGA